MVELVTLALVIVIVLAKIAEAVALEMEAELMIAVPALSAPLRFTFPRLASDPEPNSPAP